MTHAKIKPLLSADLAAARELSLAVSWPHRTEDWQLLFDLGRGFAACDGSGALIGTALWWPYGEQVGSLGVVLVAAQYQGKGIGRALMQEILDDAGTRALVLNATAEGRPLYDRLGFRAVGAIRQHQGQFQGASIASDSRIRPMRPDDRAALLALDAAAFGARRDALMDRLLQEGITVVLEAEGRVTGFAIRRVFGRGQVVGPLVAASEDEAVALAAGASAPGFLRLDIPAEMAKLGAWLSDAGLAPVGTVATMMRGTCPERSAKIRHFAISSQALG